MSEKFYIVRNEYRKPFGNWLYAMCDTLAQAFAVIHADGLTDSAVECCKGEFPFNYEVTKTFVHYGKRLANQGLDIFPES